MGKFLILNFVIKLYRILFEVLLVNDLKCFINLFKLGCKLLRVGIWNIFGVFG